MGKLFKKGIVDLELVANRLNEENGLNICRKVWYELGTVYSDMMDIKYERHVIYKKDLTECITKTINRYSKLSIKYYTRFIQSFYVYVILILILFMSDCTKDIYKIIYYKYKTHLTAFKIHTFIF